MAGGFAWTAWGFRVIEFTLTGETTMLEGLREVRNVLMLTIAQAQDWNEVIGAAAALRNVERFVQAATPQATARHAPQSYPEPQMPQAMPQGPFPWEREEEL
jgi:hypothetical protein